MATALRFTGMMSIDGGAAVSVTFQGVAESPRVWGGPPAYIDIGGPAPQPHPEHPIVIIPPGAIDGTHPELPIYLPVYPSHPIVLPPDKPAPPGFAWVYVEPYGWVLDPQTGGKPRPPGVTQGP